LRRAHPETVNIRFLGDANHASFNGEDPYPLVRTASVAGPEVWMHLPIAHPVSIESMQIHLYRTAELRLSGTLSSTTAQAELGRHFVQIHDHIVERKYPSFRVDVRTLSFVNSSAIRVFVNWISLADRARYKLVFMTDRNTTWHRLSFSVLRSLSPHTVEIDDGTPLVAGAT
jgi:hypothetical protein